MRYIIEAIRDYDQVKPEHMTYLLTGMSSVQNPSPYLFAEVIVSGHFLLKWFSYLRACMCGFSQLTPAEHKSLATKRRVTKAVYYWRNRNLNLTVSCWFLGLYYIHLLCCVTGPPATKGKFAQDHTAVPWNYDQEVLRTSTRWVLEGLCKFIEGISLIKQEF